MRYDEFKGSLDERPFKPVRIFITSGQTVDVRHPEQVLIARSMFAFAVGPKKGLPEHIGWYSLIHVVKVLPLKVVERRKIQRKGSA